MWHFEAETDSVTSTNSHETPFVIHAEFDISTVWEPMPALEEVVMRAQFSAYDGNGKRDERASLYMNDYADAEIIFI